MKSNKIFFIIFATFFIMVLCLSMFSGCSPQPHLEDNVLQIAGNYSIPGMCNPDLKGVPPVEVLERDSYGRILYSYSCYNIVTGKDEVAIAICQKADNDFVYFYEDICYLIGKHDDSDIDELKTTNDWESPYDDSKMSRRKIKYTTFDLIIINDCDQKFYTVQGAFVKAVGIEESSLYDHCLLDYDGSGLAIYLFCVNNSDGTKDQYYVISNDSYEISYVKASKLDDIVSFKKENGWKYGY